MIVEVGGTVGDIEGQPFLEAIRQIRREERPEDTLSIHVTFLPHVGSTNELKTKPTQHSVRELRSAGIQPDVILCRADHEVTADLRRKIALFCDVEERGVISLPTVDSIYEVPIVLQDENLGDYVIELLHLDAAPRDLAPWREMVERLAEPAGRRRDRRRRQVRRAARRLPLDQGSADPRRHRAPREGEHPLGAQRAAWSRSPSASLLDGVDGILVCPGFGGRGIEGKLEAARYARENKIPYLGVCLGMQMMVIEYARNVLGLIGANSTEVNQQTPHPVISLLSEQLGIEDKGGTMRLGGYPCKLVPGTKAAAAYGVDEVIERHRHRYEFNNAYRDQLEAAGLIASGTSPDGSLVEICEIVDHPFMVGSQFHPEFRSRPDRPQPLFRDFIGAAKQLRAGVDAGLISRGAADGSRPAAREYHYRDHPLAPLRVALPDDGRPRRRHGRPLARLARRPTSTASSSPSKTRAPATSCCCCPARSPSARPASSSPPTPSSTSSRRAGCWRWRSATWSSSSPASRSSATRSTACRSNR